jgi:hypothetical protein
VSFCLLLPFASVEARSRRGRRDGAGDLRTGLGRAGVLCPDGEGGEATDEAAADSSDLPPPAAMNSMSSHRAGTIKSRSIVRKRAACHTLLYQINGQV